MGNQTDPAKENKVGYLCINLPDEPAVEYLEVFLKATTGYVDSDNSTHLATITIKEPPNIAPMFVDDLSDSYQINVGDLIAKKQTSFVLKLPDVEDLNGDQIEELQVELPKGQSWISYDKKTKSLVFEDLVVDNL